MKKRLIVLGAVASLILTSAVTLGAFEPEQAEANPFRSSQISAGLIGAKYSGYFADNTSFFNSRKPIGRTQKFSRISFSKDTESRISWQWTGYFRPTKSGVWKIRTSSDDASYVWIGSDAIANYNSSNALLKAPGIHAPLPASATIELIAGAYYPIRIQYGEEGGLEEFKLFVTPPGGKETSNLSSLVFHNPRAKAPNFGFTLALATAAMKSEQQLRAASQKPPANLAETPTANLSSENCKAPRTSPWSVSLGFPRGDDLMPSVGNLRGLMIFVEFNDVKGNDDPLVVGPKFTKPFENFFRVNSYGKLNFSVDILPKYYKINKNSSSYRMNVWSSGDAVGYFADGIRAADADVDYSKYDFIAVMPPAGIKEIIYGPAFPEVRASEFNLPSERAVYRGTVGGADQRTQFDYTGWIWLGHEIGHVLGMEHQYNAFDKPSPIWDLMDNVYTDAAPGLFAWHRFQMGWFDKEHLACYTLEQAKNAEINLPLTPLDDQSKSLKSAMIRLSNNKVLVVEARVGSPIDKLSNNLQGLLAYTVDTALSGQANPIKLADQSASNLLAGQPVGTLKVGQSVVVDGFKITYTGINEKQHWVTIKSN